MDFKADFLVINLLTIDGLKTIPLYRDREKFSLTGESWVTGAKLHDWPRFPCRQINNQDNYWLVRVFQDK